MDQANRSSGASKTVTCLARAQVDLIRSEVQRAATIQAGATIGYGSDAGAAGCHGGGCEDFATGDQLGQLKAGLDADIIAKQGDPTAGISAIVHMPSVMNGGVIYKQQNPSRS